MKEPFQAATTLLLVSFFAPSYEFYTVGTNFPFRRDNFSSTALCGRRGRKSKSTPKVVVAERKQSDSTNKSIPPSAKNVALKIDRDCTIHVAQIPTDDPWWDETDNPYGARVWPPSVGIAQYLWKHRENLKGIKVLEVGCGNGLVSQAAALAGSVVQATDISSVALGLTRQGWKATSAGTGTPQQAFSLTTAIYDIAGPLPKEECVDLFVAAAVLYDGELGELMARRIGEAYALGMWIILGDDDTGFREDGRQRLMDQLRLFGGDSEEDQIPLEWKQGVVRCPELGFREKRFSILELNAPHSHPSIESVAS